MCTRSFSFSVAISGWLAWCGQAAAADPLPEGDMGIAAGYPGDVGIGADPAVVLFDDYEGYTDAAQLYDNWDAVYQEQLVTITTEAANVFAGAQALQFTLPQMDGELSDGTDKVLTEERDVLFLRYYSKFQPPYDVVGSSHNGSAISAHYFIDGQATPGVPADGMNKFLVAYENWRGEPRTMSPGVLNVYVYHPEQRDIYGDHFFPDGTISPYDPDPPPDYFGPDFVPRPEIIPALGEWNCYEYMVQANTPGQRDGRIAFWFDGALAADFQNLRLRDIETLKIDRFGLSFHIHNNPGGESSKWFDNVVAADAYVGPMYMGSSSSTDDGGSEGGVDSSGSEAGTQGESGGATASGGSASSAGETAATAGTGGSGASDTEPGAADDGSGSESGCACTQHEGSRGIGVLLVPLLLLGCRRRDAVRAAGAL
jgi:hypothetical protein